jgi:hypothetical protein
MITSATRRWLVTIATLALIGRACGGGSGTDTTVATTTTAAPVEASTTEAPTTTATTTTTTAPTTTVPEETTTTIAPFDLASLSQEQQDNVNFTCAWATEVPRQPNGQGFGIDSDVLRLQIQTGELIEPFLTATEDVGLSDTDEVRAALAGACAVFGAPTVEYLSRFA